MEVKLPIKAKLRGTAFVWTPELKRRMREIGFEPPARPEDIPAVVRRQLEHEGFEVGA